MTEANQDATGRDRAVTLTPSGLGTTREGRLGASWRRTGLALTVLLVGTVAGALVVVATHQPLLMGAALAGIAVLGLCLEKPELGVFFLVGLTYTTAFEVGSGDHGLPSLRLPFAVGLIVLALLALRPNERREIAPPGITQAMVAFAAYGLFLFLSALWAKDSTVALNGFGRYGKDMVITVGVLVLITNVGMLRLAIWGIVAGALVLSGLSVVQYVTHTFGSTYLGFAKAPIKNIVGEYQGPRAAGPLGDPNYYAQMLVVALPVAIDRAVRERRRALRYVALASAILCSVAIILTFSRGGFLGLAAVLAIFVLYKFRPLIPWLLMATVVFVVVGGGSTLYVSRLSAVTEVFTGQTRSPSSDQAIQGRSDLVRIALQMFADHPAQGVGYANYPVSYPDYGRRLGADPALSTAAHSLVPEVLAETGLIGFALWLVLLVLAIRSAVLAIHSSRAAGRPDAQGLAESLLVALIGYLVTALFLHGAYPMLYWLLLALCVGARRAVDSSLGTPLAATIEHG